MSAWPFIKLFAKSDLSICPNGFAKSSSLKLPERDMLSPASIATPKCRTLKCFTAPDDPPVDRTGLPQAASLGVILTAVLGGMARESSGASAGLVLGAGCGPLALPSASSHCVVLSLHILCVSSRTAWHLIARAEGRTWKLSGLSRIRPRTCKTSLSLHSLGVNKSEGQPELQGLGNVFHFLLRK